LRMLVGYDGGGRDDTSRAVGTKGGAVVLKGPDKSTTPRRKDADSAVERSPRSPEWGS
jgi:hypothetical protein